MSESTRDDLEEILRRIREPKSLGDAHWAICRDLVVRSDVTWRDVLSLLNSSSDINQELLSIWLFCEYKRVALVSPPLCNDASEWRRRLAEANINLDSTLQAQDHG